MQALVCMYVHVYVYFTILKNEFLLNHYDIRTERLDLLSSYCLTLDVLFREIKKYLYFVFYHM